ncbi:hypothetical protein [uncultured Thiohalocapsa sp.]|uniref:hypothetical protein n=1 Tax=uncultured Thiohalocapsa sp. TaxID=768990 RepID=UPI0025E1DC2A|nr:hypothetical protein [uncultured Thiohalocapsa sp.]
MPAPKTPQVAVTTEPQRAAHGRRRHLRRTAALWLLLACLPPAAGAVDEAFLTDADRALLVEAVEAAYELDLYNARCRNDQSGRRTENLNKELVSRYRMTVLDVLDDLFPEGYYRSARERMQEDFLTRLREMGGCAGAKTAGLRDELGARYDAAMEQVGERS